jgi:protein-tyrosine sulfotransferase
VNLKYPFLRVSEKFALLSIRRKLKGTDLLANSPQFFILSSGRSGSTLLRKLLVENLDIHIPPETNDLIVKAGKLFFLSNDNWQEKVAQFISQIKSMNLTDHWKINLNELKIKLLSLPADQQGFYTVTDMLYHSSAPDGLEYSIIGDKTPYLILRSDWLLTLFPTAKYIYVMRDGRDVVLSRMKAFNETVQDAAKRWLWSVKELEKMQVKKANIKVIRYEDLVTQPEKYLETLRVFLNANELDLPRASILGDDKLEHHKNLELSVFTDSIGQWEKELSQSNQRFLQKQLSASLDKFY